MTEILILAQYLKILFKWESSIYDNFIFEKDSNTFSKKTIILVKYM